MESIRPSPAPNKPSSKTSSSRITKTFQKILTRKPSSQNQNSTFCLLIPQKNLQCQNQSKQSSRSKASMEAFLAKLFATLSAVKAAYAELQLAQSPYNHTAIQTADQSVVSELKSLSELKYSFLKKQIDTSPPHVTLMLAEIQEQQALMKMYEITMKKMQMEIDRKGNIMTTLMNQVQDITERNMNMERKMNASGAFSVLDSIRCNYSGTNVKDFVLVLHYALRGVRNFVKFMIREMEGANWDLEAAACSVIPDVGFRKRDHQGFAFEAFVCREIFAGFNDPGFLMNMEELEGRNDGYEVRVWFYEEFRKLRGVNHVIHYVKQNLDSSFGKFLRSRYLQLVHPKMEFSFSGNLNQRKMLNSGEFPDTEFFKMFAEMGRRVWLLHCLAFSFGGEIGIFRVKRGDRFSEVYMESVTEDVFADGDVRVAFTVVPGFRVSRTVVQSQVYLSPVSLGGRSQGLDRCYR